MRRGRVVGGVVGASRPVPGWIPRPPYALPGGFPPPQHPPQETHSAEGVERMRAACALAAEVLALAGAEAKVGVTTEELDAIVHEAIVAAGAYPSPLGYAGFPKSVCTSVNDVVLHGIPDSRPLEDGDVISIDVSCFLEGVHGDTCRTFIVGTAGEEERRLVGVAAKALKEAIEIVRPEVRVGMLGHAIADVFEPNGYESVEAFCGHGVGSVFHSLPLVQHSRCENAFKLKPNTTFTIEPMIVQHSQQLELWEDGWTAATRDGSLAAQFEHTILVTENGHEVLTAYPDWEKDSLAATDPTVPALINAKC